MKQQPDKMTAYYYRAAHINTDLNLATKIKVATHLDKQVVKATSKKQDTAKQGDRYVT